MKRLKNVATNNPAKGPLQERKCCAENSLQQSCFPDPVKTNSLIAEDRRNARKPPIAIIRNYKTANLSESVFIKDNLTD